MWGWVAWGGRLHRLSDASGEVVVGVGFGAPGAGERWWALALMSAGAGGVLVGGGGIFGFSSIGLSSLVRPWRAFESHDSKH